MSQQVSSSSSRTTELNDSFDSAGAHTVGAGRADVSWKENIVGNARGGRVQNVSWGAIFAGVATIFAVVFLLIAAFGLDGSGAGASVVSTIGVLLAFFVAGGVAGSMAVRGGLVHGFLTWAASILATVLYVVVLTLGTAGGVVGSVVGGLGAAAGPSITKLQPSDVPTPTAEQSAQAQQAGQTAQQAAQATKTGATYGFFGLLLGGVVASIGGLLGSRSVNSRRSVKAGDTARTV